MLKTGEDAKVIAIDGHVMCRSAPTSPGVFVLEYWSDCTLTFRVLSRLHFPFIYSLSDHWADCTFTFIFSSFRVLSRLHYHLFTIRSLSTLHFHFQSTELTSFSYFLLSDYWANCTFIYSLSDHWVPGVQNAQTIWRQICRQMEKIFWARQN